LIEPKKSMGLFNQDEYRKKGIWLSEGALKRYTKQRFALHSDSVQSAIEKFCNNLKAARTLRKENLSIRYPYKNKGWFCVHWKKKAIKIKSRYIHLSNGKSRQGIVFKLPTYLADCQPRTVELICSLRSPTTSSYGRNGYWLSLTLFVLISHPLDFFCKIKTNIVISGRQLRSVKRNRNKRVAQLSTLQSRCKKDSRRWKRLQTVKSKVMAECHRRTRDLHHKTTRIAVNWCTEHDISKLVIGDVTGIAKNTKKKKRLNRKNRQKISQWSFYQQRQYLEYKCDEVGIETILEPENGTSKTCPKYVRCAQPQTGAFAGLRRNKYKPTGRNYGCRNPGCNLKMAVHEVTAERSEHRDVVGACNIRTKHLTGVLSGKNNFKSPSVKYLRINDPRSLKSSSGTGVARWKRRKSYRRRLGVPEQLTLIPLPFGDAIQSGMFSKT